MHSLLTVFCCIFIHPSEFCFAIFTHDIANHVTASQHNTILNVCICWINHTFKKQCSTWNMNINTYESQHSNNAVTKAYNFSQKLEQLFHNSLAFNEKGHFWAEIFLYWNFRYWKPIYVTRISKEFDAYSSNFRNKICLSLFNIFNCIISLRSVFLCDVITIIFTFLIKNHSNCHEHCM